MEVTHFAPIRRQSEAVLLDARPLWLHDENQAVVLSVSSMDKRESWFFFSKKKSTFDRWGCEHSWRTFRFTQNSRPRHPDCPISRHRIVSFSSFDTPMGTEIFFATLTKSRGQESFHAIDTQVITGSLTLVHTWWWSLAQARWTAVADRPPRPGNSARTPMGRCRGPWCNLQRRTIQEPPA